MPLTDDQLAAAYDKALAEGPENLAGTDRDYYLIQDFILEYENGLLSGYLYNRIPDFDQIRAAIDSMKKHGLTELAAILDETLMIFKNYREPNPPTTWGKVLEHYDPTGKLRSLEDRIRQIPNYGVTQ